HFVFSSRRRHTISKRDWSSDVCSSDLKYLLSLNLVHRRIGGLESCYICDKCSCLCSPPDRRLRNACSNKSASCSCSPPDRRLRNELIMTGLLNVCSPPDRRLRKWGRIL